MHSQSKVHVHFVTTTRRLFDPFIEDILYSLNFNLDMKKRETCMVRFRAREKHIL